MFSISRSDSGNVRLEIQAPPAEFSRRDARRLQSVLLDFARKLSEATEDPPPERSSLPVPTDGDRAEKGTPR